MISQKSIEEVVEAAQIKEVVEDFVQLKRRGSNYIGLCPFHAEKTPSFSVSPSKNIFKCFGCGRGGNSVQFVMEHEGSSFPESIRYLAQKFNIELEETGGSEQYAVENQERDSLFLINKFAAEYYHKALSENEEGKSIGISYFKERGYNQQTLEKFQLGYAPDLKEGMVAAARQAQYQEELVRQLGLITKNDRDFFRDRVMFPLHNLSGKVAGFAGRTMLSNPKVPKYINSPESLIYNKSKFLYGLYFAKQAIRKEDLCYIVEGYTDVITLHQNGVENVVASSGTALTEDQIRLIKRYSRNICLLFDGDPAGLKAATRGIDMILEEDMNVAIVVLPESEDPDSWMKSQGHSDFLKFIENEKKDFLLFKAESLKREAGK